MHFVQTFVNSPCLASHYKSLHVGISFTKQEFEMFSRRLTNVQLKKSTQWKNTFSFWLQLVGMTTNHGEKITLTKQGFCFENRMWTTRNGII